MIVLGKNWQAAAIGVHFEWVWRGQCACGRGHCRVMFFVGPFLFEVGL
jgi:hypothetical protein